MSDDYKLLLYNEIDRYIEKCLKLQYFYKDYSLMFLISVLDNDEVVDILLNDNTYETIGSLMYKFRDYLRDNKEIIKYIIIKNDKEMKYASDKIKNDKNLVL